MQKVLITGSQGFIGSYLCAEFLGRGYKVIGVDNFSKYGPVTRSHDNNPNFKLVEKDVLSLNLLNDTADLRDVEYICAGAAMIGGITYFHKRAYDLLATNERILSSTFDLAVELFRRHKLKRIVVLSSSMVFEQTDKFPTPETEVEICPPPLSTYGFQKLASEYFCKGAYEQYGLPYTIVRPFNCVGVGEDVAIGEDQVRSGNIELMMSHVLPDIVNKVLKGQDPLHILGDGQQIRCYTNGRDIARGIRMAMESDNGVNEDFNISIPAATSVLELVRLVWSIINPDKTLSIVSEKPYLYDVQKRIPDVSKAQKILGFHAEVSLKESVKEVVDYMKKNSF